MARVERIGRYEIVTPLAAGGMGEVLLARLRGLGGFERHVVLKTIDLSGDDRPQMRAMFLDEARLLGRLHHQHIAPVFEINEDGGKLYLVIDYVHGRTAQQVWQEASDTGSPLPFDFGLTVVAHAASGLHYAHTRTDDDGEPLRMVHRDVSLSNLMIGYDGAVKLIDFGIAKTANRRSQTQTGMVKGKLGYMAPEQLRQLEVDARTDVFALGIVLYELTTMQRPFRDQSDRMTAERIKSGAFRKPSELVTGYPPELEWIVSKALRVDPRERFDSADELRRAIDALGHRYELVLGDAAVVEVMTQLFAERREPWRLIPTARPETDLEIGHAAAVDILDDRDLPPPRPRGKPMRSATEAVEALAIELEQPVDSPADVPRGEFDEQAPTAIAAARAVSSTEAELPDDESITEDGPARPMEPPLSTNPPSAEERVHSIQRLFTQSAFDPRETPASPLSSLATGAQEAVIEAPKRVLTNRGVGDVLEPPVGRATTDGVQLIPPTPVAPAPSKPRSSRTILWIVLALVLLGGLGAVAYVLITHDENEPKISDAAGAPPDSATIAADSAAVVDTAADAGVVASDTSTADATITSKDATVVDATTGRTVTIKLTSVPPGATVVLDGKRLGKTPFEGPVELLGKGPHAIKVRLTGHNTVKLDLDGDLEREVTLTKAKPKPEEPKEAPGGLEILD